eukprot:gene9257-9423_t
MWHDADGQQASELAASSRLSGDGATKQRSVALQVGSNNDKATQVMFDQQRGLLWDGGDVQQVPRQLQRQQQPDRWSSQLAQPQPGSRGLFCPPAVDSNEYGKASTGLASRRCGMLLSGAGGADGALLSGRGLQGQEQGLGSPSSWSVLPAPPAVATVAAVAYDAEPAHLAAAGAATDVGGAKCSSIQSAAAISGAPCSAMKLEYGSHSSSSRTGNTLELYLRYLSACEAQGAPPPGLTATTARVLKQDLLQATALSAQQHLTTAAVNVGFTVQKNVPEKVVSVDWGYEDVINRSCVDGFYSSGLDQIRRRIAATVPGLSVALDNKSHYTTLEDTLAMIRKQRARNGGPVA